MLNKPKILKGEFIMFQILFTIYYHFKTSPCYTKSLLRPPTKLCTCLCVHLCVQVHMYVHLCVYWCIQLISKQISEFIKFNLCCLIIEL